jgi:hypothetical protein
MANWKKIVSSVDNKQFQGWETTEEVAAQLECRPDAVATVLRQAIRQGDVEQKTFTFWNDRTKQIETTVGYRQRPKQEVYTADTPASAESSLVVRGRPRKHRKLVPAAGLRVMSKTGKIGVMDQHLGRWRVVWDHCPPTYPNANTMRRGCLRPVD